MKLYSKSILLSLSKNIIFILLALIGVILINKLNLLLNIGIKISNIYIILYIVPYIVSIILPFTVAIATMILLYQYRQEQRIIILQNFGLNPFNIYKSFFYLCLTIVIIHYIIYIIIPYSDKAFRLAQRDIINHNFVNVIEFGKLKTYHKGLTIYIESFLNKKLNNVFICDFRNKDNIMIFTAKSGYIYFDKDMYIVLENGIVQNNLGSIQFELYSITISEQAIDNKKFYINEFTLLELINYDDHSSEIYNEIKILLHQKFIWPIYSILFMFICIKMDWYFYYKRYSRSMKNNSIIVIVLLCSIIAMLNLSLQSFSIEHLYLGIILMYILPSFSILLIQMLT